MPSIVVAILNWNGKSFLEEFLPGVIEHSSTAEIVVIDNASTDDSVRFLKSNFPSVRIIQNDKNYGYSGGYNEGLKSIHSDYVVLLNSDIEVKDDWISPVISEMENDKSIAVAQPKILSLKEPDKFEYAGAAGGFIDKDFYPFCRGRMFEIAEADKGQYDTSKEVFWATGACLFVRKSAYDEVLGLDPDFFAHMEEIDLCWRLKNRGYKVMAIPQSKVYHLGGGTLNYTSPRKTYLNFRNNLYLIHKNYFSGSLFQKILKRMILDGIAGAKFLFSGKFKHVGAILKAHFHYYKNLSILKSKRRLLKGEVKNQNHTGIYQKSILISFFLKGRKKFSDLNESDFL